MCSAVSRLPFVRTGEGTECIFTEEIFKNRLLLLKRCVDEDESLQLEILYASQVAVTKLKHPPSKGKKKTRYVATPVGILSVFLCFCSVVLHQIFTSLYNVEVVSESAFRAWKEGGSEELGRGVSLQASNAFFEWLGPPAESVMLERKTVTIIQELEQTRDFHVSPLNRQTRPVVDRCVCRSPVTVLDVLNW